MATWSMCVALVVTVGAVWALMPKGSLLITHAVAIKPKEPFENG